VKSRKILFASFVMFGLAIAPQVRAQTTPAPAPLQISPQAPDEPIGNVATVQGAATVTRNNSTNALKVQDDIYKNDVLATAGNSTLGITFNDETTFSLTANSRIVVDNFVYEEGAKGNAALFNVARGTVAFVASAVAKTGDMTISTPTATLGIRGTTGLVEVPEGVSATSANNVGIKLYPDADGKVGRIDIRGRDGAQLGLLTQGATGFAIRGGAGGRFSAVPLQISPQQIARDQGIVRQVHAAQSAGRQIVQQQRALRQQRNPQQRQPGLQKQNNLQKQPPGLQKQNDLQKGPPGSQKQQSGQQTRRPELPNQPEVQKQTGQPIPQSPRLQNPQQRGPLGLPKQQKRPPPPSGEKPHRRRL
jgi:hypothetical protein